MYIILFVQYTHMLYIVYICYLEVKMLKDMFLFGVLNIKIYLFDQKYIKNCEILLEFKSAVFYINMC